MSALTENEIRPDELMAEQARRFENDVRRLMAHKHEFVRVPCPACDQMDGRHTFIKYGMDYETCPQCETIYANPRPSPEHLESYYTHSENYEYWSKYIFPASENARREKIFKPRVQRVLSVCDRFQLPTRMLLEVGAGFGIFCEEMMKTGRVQHVVGVEPTPDLAEVCRTRGITTIQKLVEQIDLAELEAYGGQADVVANFEVIEHLFSPRDFLQQCAKIMRPGAVLILTCPNGKGFDVTVLRELSSAVDVEHINLFNPESLALLMRSCGFDVIESQTPGQLDAELVRKQILSGAFDAKHHPFLQRVLIDDWDRVGNNFQRFITDNNLSSNMMLIARRRAEDPS